MSPRTKDQVEKIKQERKSQIIKVALELFAAQGYHTTSIDQIARKASISKGLVYNYFEGKEALLRAAFDEGFEEIDQTIAHFEANNPRQSLRHIIRVYFKLLRERSIYYKLLMEVTLNTSQFPFYKDYVAQRYENYFELVRNLLLESNYPDAENEARLLTALFDGIGTQFLIMNEKYPLDQYEEIIIAKYCK